MASKQWAEALQKQCPLFLRVLQQYHLLQLLQQNPHLIAFQSLGLRQLMETTAGLSILGSLLATTIVLPNAFLFLLFLWILSSLQNCITHLVKMNLPREEEPHPLLVLLVLLHQLGPVLPFYLLLPVHLKLVVPLQRLTRLPMAVLQNQNFRCFHYYHPHHLLPLPMVALQYQNFHHPHNCHPHHLLLGLNLLPSLLPPLHLPVLHTSIQSIDPILITGHHHVHHYHQQSRKLLLATLHCHPTKILLHHHHQQMLKLLLATLHHHPTKIHHLPLVLRFVTHFHHPHM